MWAALPAQPPKPWPPNAIPTTTKQPPPGRHSMVVRSNRQEMGGLGRAVVTALKSNTSQPPQPKTRTPAPAAEKKELTERQQQPRQLSGSDVLMALQRATAQKEKAKKINKQKIRDSRRDSEGSNSYLGNNTRPLCIKPEWRDRLEELETRLAQLAHGC